MATPATADPAERIATALLVSPHEGDHLYFETLFSRTNWRLHHVYNTQDALAMLRDGLAPVIIVDEALDGEGWSVLLEAIRRSPVAPKLLVTSLLVSGSPSLPALDDGAYDILARPLVQQEVLHSISMAWLAWKCERYAGASLMRPLQIAATPAAASATKTIE